MKCKKCKYYEAAKNHGHGEYYGTCKVAYYLQTMDKWHYRMNKYTIKSDEDECELLKYMTEKIIPDYPAHH